MKNHLNINNLTLLWALANICQIWENTKSTFNFYGYSYSNVAIAPPAHVPKVVKNNIYLSWKKSYISHRNELQFSWFCCRCCCSKIFCFHWLSHARIRWQYIIYIYSSVRLSSSHAWWKTFTIPFWRSEKK